MDSAAKTATAAIARREGQKTRHAPRRASEPATAARMRSVALASYAMPELQLASFWSDNQTEILTAVGTVLVALAIAEVVNVVLKRRGEDELSPVAKTRLRLIRRLIFTGIILFGIGLALAQFDAVQRVATGLLASSAVLGLVVGFAARQTLANGVAGILLAITQPIRVGDIVTFQEETGEVEDIRLTYTYLRLDDGRRLVIPNEQLAESPVHNHSIEDPRVQVVVDLWLAHGADTDRALESAHGAGRGRGLRGGGHRGGHPDARHDLGGQPARPRPHRRPPESPQPPPAAGARPILRAGSTMTHRQRKQRRRRHRSPGSKVLLGLGVIVIVLLIAVLSVAGYVIAIAATAPDLSELKPIEKGESSVIFAADGSRLGYVRSDEIRTPVPWHDMPQHLRDATVAIEDERFYEHSGVDVNAIIRAGIKNIESGETVQGGSTITQQLVRALYIKDPERTFVRKIREAKLAEELEDKHSKQWILQNYLNDVPYGTVGGRTAIGIEAAAETFFDKHARDLTLAEAALLAGLPQAPSQYNPFRNQSAALRRRNDVLDKMLENGMITAAEAAEASQAALRLKQGTRYTSRREPYFFDYVEEKLIEQYGVGVYRRGGLKVYTTVDPEMQDAARDAINSYVYDGCRPVLRGGHGQPGERRDQGDGLERHLPGPHVQPGRAGAPPAGLRLQDLRADDGDPQGGRPGQHHLRLQATQHEHPRLRPVAGQDLRRQLLGHDDPLQRDAGLRQHGVRPAHRRPGPEGGVRDGQAARHHDQARLPAGRGPGRPQAGRDAARDGERIRHAGRRRHSPPADGDPQGRVPGREVGGALEPQGQARADRRRGLRGHEDPQGQRDRAARA